ncbi:MAG: glycosyltransferase family 4 protein [Patescibacteria group bacterium]
MNNNNLKIAEVVCLFPPQVGGIGMVAHNHARGLTANGFAVTVFAPKCEQDLKKDKTYKVEALWPLIKKGFAAVLPQLFWRLRKFDIVHLHYPFFGSSLITALAKKFWKNRFKLVITYHQDVSLKGFANIYEKLGRKFFLKWILNQADKIIISSEDYVVHSHIQEYYLKNIGRFMELPFSVDCRFCPQKKEEILLKKYNLRSEDKVILFVGGLDSAHYFKGVNFLIKAFAKVENPNAKCLIVGKGNMRKEYEKMVRDMNLQEKIIFAGYVNDKDLPCYYNLGDIFILPSINKNEAFGIVLIEAMASGLSLIASNLKGVRRVVNPGVNGLLVEPKNSDDLADKINYLLKNPQLMQQFSELGQKIVAEKYRPEVVTKKLIEIYNNL